MFHLVLIWVHWQLRGKWMILYYYCCQVFGTSVRCLVSYYPLWSIIINYLSEWHKMTFRSVLITCGWSPLLQCMNFTAWFVVITCFSITCNLYFFFSKFESSAVEVQYQQNISLIWHSNHLTHCPNIIQLKPSVIDRLYSKKYFIAINFHNNEAVIQHHLTQVLRTISVLGSSRVFVSVYQSNRYIMFWFL